MRRFGRRGWIAILAALACCGAMAVLEANRMANAAETGTEAALSGAGLGDEVSYAGIEGFDGIGRDGLNIALEGPASSEAAAVEAVRARSEVDQVTYRVTDDETAAVEADVDPEPEADDTPATVADTEPPPAVDLDPATVAANATGSAIDLVGTVPDEPTRSAVIATAVNEYGAANVTHDIVVDPEAVTLDGATLVLNGDAASDDEQAGWLSRARVIAEDGGLELVDRSVVKTVDQSLNELFALEPIEFDVNQATIRSRSEPTLMAAAELIRANPDVGRLRVIGHTDSDGSAGVNEQLSQARAQAVVDYLVANGGVDPDRLEADGRGESELLVDPEVTPEDKQRNRRIEWELLP